MVPEGPGEVEVANAGHIPPLVVRARGASYLEPAGTLLGIDDRDEGAPVRVPLEAGTRLVLMTDGLVERRAEPIGPALTRLADEVAACTGDGTGAEELCDRLMRGWGDGEDDICLLVIDVLDPV